MFKVFTRLSRMVRNLRAIVGDGLSFFVALWRRRTALAAEIHLPEKSRQRNRSL
jgi:hypothetical protein